MHRAAKSVQVISVFHIDRLVLSRRWRENIPPCIKTSSGRTYIPQGNSNYTRGYISTGYGLFDSEWIYGSNDRTKCRFQDVLV